MPARRLPRSPAGTEVAPTTVRLPPELREAIAREAEINGRTVSAEIVERLELTLHGPDLSPSAQAELDRLADKLVQVNDAQRMLLSLFDAMPPDKQLALLTVLRR